MTEDQRAEWRKALTANARRQRARRGKRRALDASRVTGPAMVRLHSGAGDPSGQDDPPRARLS